jgi:hypothetical protein
MQLINEGGARFVAEATLRMASLLSLRRNCDRRQFA